MKKRIQFRERKLVYSDHGEGTCIVLLHGYLERGEIWQPFTELFPEGFRFIVPDLPGHGDSDSWGKVHSMEDLAASLMAILEAEKIDKV
ncbi:MAG: alpha/beta fold hydrolase, partial [Bacteroidetes bacterium]|nr:alpha/beta fold hydrolase [Bacteroidota bacterium]